MKFIIIERKLKDGFVELIPIIFPNNLVHLDVYHNLTGTTKDEVKCVSAGDFNPILGCSGESVTLGIKCKNGSSNLIANIDYYSVFTKDNYPLR